MVTRGGAEHGPEASSSGARSTGEQRGGIKETITKAAGTAGKLNQQTKEAAEMGHEEIDFGTKCLTFSIRFPKAKSPEEHGCQLDLSGI